MSFSNNVVKKDLSSLQNQIIASLVVNLGTLSLGAAIGWLSPVLVEITSENSPLGAPLTAAQVALSGGIFCLGGFSGLPFFTIITSKYGRKIGGYCIGIPITIGLLFKLCANSVMVMLMGRFLCGFGGAGCLSLPTLLVGECCSTRIRGLLAALLPVLYSFGLMSAYLLGAHLPFRIFTVALMTMPVLFMILYWFIPETPVYLLKIGKEQEAAKAISWYRKISVDGGEVRAELLRISRQLRGAEPLQIEFEPSKEELATELAWIHLKLPENQQKMLSQYTEEPLSDRPSPWKILFTSYGARRALMLCLFIVMSQVMMGLFALDSYLSVIFNEEETGLSADTCGLIYTGIFAVGSSIGSLLMDRTGRRPLQIISSVVVFFGQGILGWCFQDPTAPKWLSFLGLFMAVCGFNTGPGIMQFVLASEVFANDVRDVATSVIMESVWFTSYFLLQIFPLAVEAFKLHNVFYFFSAVALITAVISYFVLPETKGFSQEEILRKFAGLKPSKNASENEKMNELRSV